MNHQQRIYLIPSLASGRVTGISRLPAAIDCRIENIFCFRHCY
jgi:hypothetical protein